MYHNIFTVRKRLWGTITCSWISVLPRHASAFHMSHPTIRRMCERALLPLTRMCLSQYQPRTALPLIPPFSSINMVFGTHTPLITSHAYERPQNKPGLRGMQPWWREQQVRRGGYLGQTVGRWDVITGLYSWVLFGWSSVSEGGWKLIPNQNTSASKSLK